MVAVSSLLRCRDTADACRTRGDGDHLVLWLVGDCANVSNPLFQRADANHGRSHNPDMPPSYGRKLNRARLSPGSFSSDTSYASQNNAGCIWHNVPSRRESVDLDITGSAFGPFRIARHAGTLAH
jgi:hypothetical protein